MRISDWSSDVCSSDLLEADAALDHPALPPVSYWCRVVRLGKIAGRNLIESFAPKFCYIRDEEKGLSFTKQSGSDLPAGYLYADGERRYVFLGARQDAPGDVSLGYGVDPDRDVAGVVERVGRSEEHTAELQSLMRLS